MTGEETFVRDESMCAAPQKTGTLSGIAEGRDVYRLRTIFGVGYRMLNPLAIGEKDPHDESDIAICLSKSGRRFVI